MSRSGRKKLRTAGVHGGQQPINSLSSSSPAQTSSPLRRDSAASQLPSSPLPSSRRNGLRDPKIDKRVAKKHSIGSDEGLLLKPPQRIGTPISSLNSLRKTALEPSRRTITYGGNNSKFKPLSVNSPVTMYRFNTIENETTLSTGDRFKHGSESDEEFSDTESNEQRGSRLPSLHGDSNQDVRGIKRKISRISQTRNINTNGTRPLDNDEKVLSIDSCHSSTDLLDYTLLKFPSEKVVFGISKKIVRNGGENASELNLILDIGLEFLQIRSKSNESIDSSPANDDVISSDTDGLGTTMFHAALKELRSIQLSDEALLFNFKNNIKWENSWYDRLAIFGSSSNIKRFKMFWKMLPNGMNKFQMNSIGTEDLNNSLSANGGRFLAGLGSNQKNASSSLSKFYKPMQSLIKRPSSKGSAIKKVSTPSKVTAPEQFERYSSQKSTPTDSFYSNARSSGVGRMTRSITQHANPESESIQVIDELAPKRKKQIAARINFKPSLHYKFKDSSVMRIRNTDFKCLYGSQWINDTLIDFFVKFLPENPNPIPKFNSTNNTTEINSDQIQVLSTFFFNKLKSTDDFYGNVKKWLSRYKLSDKKYILLPVNETQHWYLVIIHNVSGLLSTGKEISSDDKFSKQDQGSTDNQEKLIDKDVIKELGSLQSDSEQKPGPETRSRSAKDDKCTIYVLDSLKQTHNDILGPIRSFLQGYAKDHHDLDIPDSRISLKVGTVPKQNDFNNCGVHVIFNVMKFISNEDRIIRLWNNSTLSGSMLGRLTSEIFSKTERAKMRDELRNLLVDLQKDQIERGDVISDDEAAVDDNDENDDDIIYLDADEYHNSLKNSIEGSKEGSVDIGEEDQNKHDGESENKGNGELDHVSEREEEKDIDTQSVKDNEGNFDRELCVNMLSDALSQVGRSIIEKQDEDSVFVDKDTDTGEEEIPSLQEKENILNIERSEGQRSQRSQSSSSLSSSGDIELIGVEVYESSSQRNGNEQGEMDLKSASQEPESIKSSMEFRESDEDDEPHEMISSSETPNRPNSRSINIGTKSDYISSNKQVKAEEIESDEIRLFERSANGNGLRKIEKRNGFNSVEELNQLKDNGFKGHEEFADFFESKNSEVIRIKANSSKNGTPQKNGIKKRTEPSSVRKYELIDLDEEIDQSHNSGASVKRSKFFQ